MILDSWLQLASDESGLLFEKELLPVSTYHKHDESTGEVISFDIDKKFLDHVVEETKRMHADGVPTKLYLNHIRDASKRRGNVTDVFIKKNEKGVDSLFAKIKFADDVAKTEGLRNDVSVSIPKVVFSGSGKQFRFSLEHVAITSNPVVPGLEGYVAISASFEPQSGANMKAILSALGLEASDDAKKDEAAALGAIKKLKSGGKGDTPPAKKDDDKKGPPDLSFKLPKAYLAELTSSRTRRVDTLVKDNKISPAERDRLVEKYCNNERVSLDMSQDDAESAFDDLMLSHERNSVEVVKREGRSEQGADNGFTLSHVTAKDNPLIADMERRVKENA